MCDRKFKKEEEDTSSSSADDQEDVEENAVDEDEDIAAIEHVFKQKYKIKDEISVTLNDDYVQSVCHDKAFTRLVAGMSNGCAQLIDLIYSGIKLGDTLEPFKDNKKNISTCGVRFLDDESNCLLVGTTDGVVRLFDLRASARVEQATFWDTSSGSKNITCFDRNANSTVLCTGTELKKDDVFLLFYDIRERKPVGGYFDCHSDDITSIAFHDTNSNRLCTGANDGLINIFDISKESESDALTTTINTESCVHKLNWHRNLHYEDIISCVTPINELKLYEFKEGDLVVEFERSQITAAIKRKSPANCNLIGAHSAQDDSIFLLSGTNNNKSEILRSVKLQWNNEMTPLANFEGNRQVVRCSAYNKDNNAVVTGGECGMVTIWLPPSNTNESTTRTNSISHQLKAKTKTKRSAPY